MSTFEWQSLNDISSQKFICGYCGADIASNKGWAGKIGAGTWEAYIAICHRCTQPTFLHQRRSVQVPGVKLGQDVHDIPDHAVKDIYDEARKATGAGAYTAAVLCCRKLLMHVAVAKGAGDDLKFFQYVQYLLENHYIPPDAAEWVNHIRDRGNEANHEIVLMSEADAEELISFCEMLLKVIYEYPARMRAKQGGG